MQRRLPKPKVWLVALAASSCVLWDSNPQDPLAEGCGAPGSVGDGDPCVCAEECRSGFCNTELVTGVAMGTCVSECTNSRACQDGDICLVGDCVPRCERPSDCGPSRICAKITDDDSGDGGCFPLCQSDGDCRSGNCNLWSGRCLPPGDEPIGVGVSKSCTEHVECKSNFCFRGGCDSFCSVQADACPDNASCPRQGTGDFSSCRLPCDGPDDCSQALLDLGWQECETFVDGLGYCEYADE